jgi:uncharacterized protein YndB with AHSA1/START domain
MAKGKLKITQSYYFDAPPAKVFATLTEPDQLIRWFLSKAKVDLKKGGKVEFTWEGGHKMVGMVMRVVADKEITYAWRDELGRGKVARTSAEFKISKKGRGSMLKLNHSGFGDSRVWIELFGAIQSGWAYYLTNLKSVLQNDVDLRSKHDWT